MPKCAECRAGEIDMDAEFLVEHPNPNRPNLRVRKWVCEEHYVMLGDDYSEGELRELRRLPQAK